MFGHFFFLFVLYHRSPSHKCSFFLLSCGYFSYSFFVVDRANGLGQKDVHNLDVGHVTRFVSQLETNVEINNLKSDPGLKETTMMPSTLVPEQSAQHKRQRPPEENTETFAERKPKKSKVKDEHLKKEEVNEAAEEANDEIDTGNDALCVMCSEQPRTVMLLPCHCFNFCKDCVSESTHCFTCRVPIERKMEAY